MYKEYYVSMINLFALFSRCQKIAPKKTLEKQLLHIELKLSDIYITQFKYLPSYDFIYIYVCVCVCVVQLHDGEMFMNI